jgi:hypothetical protein
MKSANLLLGLLAIALLPGLAHAQGVPNADAEGRLRGFEGQVVGGAGVSSDPGELTIRDPRTGEERVISMTSSDGQPNFRIKSPGYPDPTDFGGSMKPGSGVAVLARQVGGQWMAVEVLVKPEEPTMAPRTGVVMGSNPETGTITILTSSGITRTLQLEDGAPTPADGDLIIAFAGPGHPSSSSAGLERVTGLTRAAAVRERLERNLEEVTSGASDLNGGDPTVKANHADSLMDLLDHQTSRHFERLEKALEHTSNGNQRALVEALVHTRGALQQGRVRAAELRADRANDAGQPVDQSVDNDESVSDRGNGNAASDNAGGDSGNASGNASSASDSASDSSASDSASSGNASSGNASDDAGSGNASSASGSGNASDDASSASGSGNASDNAGSGNASDDASSASGSASDNAGSGNASNASDDAASGNASDDAASGNASSAGDDAGSGNASSASDNAGSGNASSASDNAGSASGNAGDNAGSDDASSGNADIGSDDASSGNADIGNAGSDDASSGNAGSDDAGSGNAGSGNAGSGNGR